MRCAGRRARQRGCPGGTLSPGAEARRPISDHCWIWRHVAARNDPRAAARCSEAPPPPLQRRPQRRAGAAPASVGPTPALRRRARSRNGAARRPATRQATRHAHAEHSAPNIRRPLKRNPHTEHAPRPNAPRRAEHPPRPTPAAPNTRGAPNPTALHAPSRPSARPAPRAPLLPRGRSCGAHPPARDHSQRSPAHSARAAPLRLGPPRPRAPRAGWNAPHVEAIDRSWNNGPIDRRGACGTGWSSTSATAS